MLRSLMAAKRQATQHGETAEKDCPAAAQAAPSRLAIDIPAGTRDRNCSRLQRICLSCEGASCLLMAGGCADSAGPPTRGRHCVRPATFSTRSALRPGAIARERSCEQPAKPAFVEPSEFGRSWLHKSCTSRSSLLKGFRTRQSSQAVSVTPNRRLLSA